MKHKLSFRGFTLIELLVVIAIIGLLSTVIAAPITEARKKGRDAKKIADIRSISTALQIYADDNAGTYPDSVTSLVPRYLATFPSNAASSTVSRDKYMYAYYSDSVGRRMGYHLGVKLESGNQALNDDRDCGGFASSTGACPDSSLGVTSVTASNFSGTAGAAFASEAPAGGPSLSNDFGGGIDTGTSTCTAAITNCVYDLTNN